MQHLAPIALFVYNRPEHTRRTIIKLQQNLLAEESRLFVFSDAPKTQQDAEKVAEVRKILDHIDGFKAVKLIYRSTSTGLANSITSGVSQLVNEYGKVIVFEDDLLSSPHTLTYFNEALYRYAETDRVMQIAAYMFPIHIGASIIPETFFIRSINSWGWATWKRAWQHYEADINRLFEQFDQDKIKAFTLDGTMNYWQQLLDFKNGKNDSWAIRWHASVFLKNGLVLQPATSLIENIGHDGSGIHSIIEDTYHVTPSRKAISYFPQVIEEDKKALELIKHFYKHRKGSWLKRGKKFITNKWYQMKRMI